MSVPAPSPREWELAHAKWEQLTPVRDLYAEKFLWIVARTATYASALAYMKLWFEIIGLNAGPIVPPVAQPSPGMREELTAELQALGIA